MTDPDPPEELDPAAAFDAMGRRLAGLTAAIDGLSARLLEIEGRDYSAELARIDARFEKVRGALNNLSDRPAMALTPEMVVRQIEAAAQTSRQADHEAWERAQIQMNRATNTITEAVVITRTAEAQKRAITVFSVIFMTIGLLLGFIMQHTI